MCAHTAPDGGRDGHGTQTGIGLRRSEGKASVLALDQGRADRQGLAVQVQDHVAERCCLSPTSIRYCLIAGRALADPRVRGHIRIRRCRVVPSGEEAWPGHRLGVWRGTTTCTRTT